MTTDGEGREIGFKNTMACPVWNELHEVEYSYKDVPMLACPKMEPDKMLFINKEKELKEYRKVVKRCECCKKLEYHEFVKSEPEGYYCESCWDDVKG